MNKIDWYYVYSQRYSTFHRLLQDSVDKNLFRQHPLFVDQSFFDEHLYKHDGEHFLSRITIKIDKTIDIIESRIREENKAPFIFSDCDLLVRPDWGKRVEYYSKLFEFDIIFQREFLTSFYVNNGFMMMIASEKTLKFWNDVRDLIINEKIVDIQAVNRVLNGTHITYSCFSVRDVASCQTMKTDEPCIYHILCGSISREQDMEDKYFEARRFGVDIDKYMT